MRDEDVRVQHRLRRRSRIFQMRGVLSDAQDAIGVAASYVDHEFTRRETSASPGKCSSEAGEFAVTAVKMDKGVFMKIIPMRPGAGRRNALSAITSHRRTRPGRCAPGRHELVRSSGHAQRRQHQRRTAPSR